MEWAKPTAADGIDAPAQERFFARGKPYLDSSDRATSVVTRPRFCYPNVCRSGRRIPIRQDQIRMVDSVQRLLAAAAGPRQLLVLSVSKPNRLPKSIEPLSPLPLPPPSLAATMPVRAPDIEDAYPIEPA